MLFGCGDFGRQLLHHTLKHLIRQNIYSHKIEGDIYLDVLIFNTHGKVSNAIIVYAQGRLILSHKSKDLTTPEVALSLSVSLADAIYGVFVP